MKKLIILFLSVFIFISIVSCTADKKAVLKETGSEQPGAVLSGPAESSTADYSDVQVLKALLNSGRTDYYLVDVRTPEEYKAGHIPKAENIPLSTIGSKPPAADKKALIILYCRSGNRSGQAKKILDGMGYTNVHNFGGIGKWTDQLEY